MGTDPVAFLEDTVPIESHEDVSEMRDYLVENVTGATEHASGCVVAEKGDGEETVILNTHMDTVAPHVPYGRDEGVVRGRGACDAKGPLAAMVSAYERFDASESDRTVRLVVSPDEETTSQGIYDYLREEAEGGEAGGFADFAVVGEPTSLDICTAAKGRYEATVVFHGESAHAASGDGRNAVSCAAEAVRRLEALEGSHDELLGESRLTVTRFEGGESSNQVPERATVTLDRRPLPDETEEDFVTMVEEALKGINCGYEVVLPDSPSPESAAFRTDEDNDYVRRFVGAVRETCGDADVRPFGAACEASYIAEHAPVVVFGPGAISEDDGTPVAHSEREYVRTDEVRKAADALTRFLQS
ncbi:MAG: M20 family metallopeptidase [Halobacteriales archaeon]|nr:M20 family metallopeptidase [Halobacteriales archaeon]